jgi:PAS domain S-box-containing protein
MLCLFVINRPDALIPDGLWEDVAPTLDHVDALYEYAPVGLCVFDLELRYLRINRRLAAINGRPVADHIGRTVRDVVPALADSAEQLRSRIVASGEAVMDIEVAGDTPAHPGEVHVWRQHWWPIRDHRGTVAALNVAVEDVTVEKQLSDALRAADLAKNQFLATVSHELRGPLNIIRGWADMLLKGDVEPSRATEALRRIDRAAAAQQRLIDDLLDVTRLTNGKIELRCELVSLHQVFTVGCDAIREALRGKPVHLSVTVEGDGLAWGDPVRLQQIVTNLLDNSAKFTTTGDIVVVGRASEAGTIITVRDTGCGIDPANLDRIFGQFHQGCDASPRTSGVGLGLFIVRELVTLHGGTVRAESAGPGHGATFTIQLPPRQWPTGDAVGSG